jgi:hypothetical protein
VRSPRHATLPTHEHQPDLSGALREVFAAPGAVPPLGALRDAAARLRHLPVRPVPGAAGPVHRDRGGRLRGVPDGRDPRRRGGRFRPDRPRGGRLPAARPGRSGRRHRRRRLGRRPYLAVTDHHQDPRPGRSGARPRPASRRPRPPDRGGQLGTVALARPSRAARRGPRDGVVPPRRAHRTGPGPPAPGGRGRGPAGDRRRTGHPGRSRPDPAPAPASSAPGCRSSRRARTSCRARSPRDRTGATSPPGWTGLPCTAG